MQKAQTAVILVIALTSTHAKAQISLAEQVIDNYHTLTLQIGEKIVISAVQ